MDSLDNLCLGCMKDKRDATQCPFCGYEVDTPTDLPFLSAGTILAERYLVGRNISRNGEGSTYIAFDTQTETAVEVREFLPPTLCERSFNSDNVVIKEGMKTVYNDYLADFVENGRALARLKSVSAIVNVRDILELNSTAYIVYEHLEGVTLFDAVNHNKNGHINWDEAKVLFEPLVSSVAAAHAIGLMHFGISPQTIVLTSKGKLILTGFGIPEAYICETEIDATPADGFAAIEQYSLEGKKGKWTDVYALAATMFYVLTGAVPPDAIKRSYDPSLNIPRDLAMSIPTHVVTALAHGLQIAPEGRTRSVEKFKEELFADQARTVDVPGKAEFDTRQAAPAKAQNFTQNVPKKTMHNAEEEEEAVKPKDKSNIKMILITAGITAGALLLVIIIALFVLGGSSHDNTSSELSSILPESDVSAAVSDETVSESEASGDLVQYEVPNYVGKRFEYAQQAAGEKFRIVITSREFNDEYEEGYIISQDVDPKTMVAEGTTINVVVSQGSEMRKIPRIVGKDVDDAVKLLEDAGLKLGNTTEVYSDSVKKGKIISIEGHEAGDKVKFGTEIHVKVSKGQEGSESQE